MALHNLFILFGTTICYRAAIIPQDSRLLIYIRSFIDTLYIVTSKYKICTTTVSRIDFNTVIITLQRVSKRSSFRYAFQEYLLKFLMLALIESE
jgi:hypothetical protein